MSSFPDIVEHFKYGSIGAEENSGVPSRIWRVLPTVCESALPKRPGVGYERIGFINDGGRARATDRHVVPARQRRSRRAELRHMPRRHAA